MIPVYGAQTTCVKHEQPPDIDCLGDDNQVYCTALTETVFQHNTTCEPYLVTKKCWRNGDEEILIYPEDGTTMSDLKIARPSTALPTCQERQILDFHLIGTFNGTITDVVTAALAADAPDDFDISGTAVVVDDTMICDYGVTVFPCKSILLTDPTDPTSGQEVAAEGTYIGGAPAVGATDPEKGGVKLDRPIVQVADGASSWCIAFRYCEDKAGVRVNSDGSAFV